MGTLGYDGFDSAVLLVAVVMGFAKGAGFPRGGGFAAGLEIFNLNSKLKEKDFQLEFRFESS